MKSTRYNSTLWTIVLHCTSILRAYWSCFDRDRVRRKLPPTRYKPQQMQTTKICACHEQPTPYRNFPTKTSNINRKKEKKKNKRKKQIQRMSTCQHKTVLYPTCADALCRFFADHENHGCVVLKRTEDKTLERKIFKYVTLLD